MANVLIVDDEESICWSLSRILSDEGHRVSVASSAEEAFRHAASDKPEVVLLDVRLPGIDGLSAMSRLTQLAPEVQILVMTAFGDLQTAVSAFGNGAVDYLSKPFDMDTVIDLVDRAASPTKEQIGEMPASSADDRDDERLIGACPAMQEVFRRIALVAPTDSSVLITGESGTGKELVARALHRHSLRAGAPLVPINLAALSPSLVESELFGHVQGAFTGADRSRVGLLELAAGGTVFFDEIADVPLNLQVKLLRTLEQQELTPVGDTRIRRTSFRVIAATSGDLIEAIRAGRFREDLYFRLAVFQVQLPPLRDRLADVPLLADHFLNRPNCQARLSPEALERLRSRYWPGNVRELRNTLETAVILARGGPILPSHLPEPLLDERRRASNTAGEISELVRGWADDALGRSPEIDDLYQQLMALVEPPLLEAALLRCGGNRLQAAKSLGLHRTTLRKKLGQVAGGEQD